MRCEIWIGTPSDLLPVHVSDEVFEISGHLEVADPGGRVTAALPQVRGSRRLVVRADDEDFASRVQLVVDPD